VEEEANVCPFCGKVNPVGPLRCPKCRSPTQQGWVKCSHCGLSLQVACPKCGKLTFFGDYCDKCGNRITVVCPNPKCRTEQPPIGAKCIKCGKPLGNAPVV
jgi:rRNA maturation protein Nop10